MIQVLRLVDDVSLHSLSSVSRTLLTLNCTNIRCKPSLVIKETRKKYVNCKRCTCSKLYKENERAYLTKNELRYSYTKAVVKCVQVETDGSAKKKNEAGAVCCKNTDDY